jgi:cephalosporin-C deacetylase-like acetyl esterase
MHNSTGLLHKLARRQLLLLLLLSSASPALADPRADFLKLIDRPRVPLAAEVKPLESRDPALEEYHFTFATDANQRVPGILIKQKPAQPAPATAQTLTRRPVVITLHGTGGTKEGERPLLVELAKRGFIAVAIDGRYHGERTKAGRGSAEYEQAILRAWRENGTPGNRRGLAPFAESAEQKVPAPLSADGSQTSDKIPEHPFFYDTAWDVMRLIDYLTTRDDVDSSRIGLYGTSKGGIEAYLAAAADPRIAAVVPCIGMQSFAWALENNAWPSRIETVQTAFDAAAKNAGVNTPGPEFVREFYQRVAPGIDGPFDGPAMIALIAPRPLMLINGDRDPRTPLPGLKLCTDAAAAAYQAANASDRFVINIQPNTGHRVNNDSRAAAIDFLAKWLKP